MCGIVGTFGCIPNKERRVTALNIVSRRGPEASRDCVQDSSWMAHAALGFVREGRNPQPLSEDDHTLIYNGEIYNWSALSALHKLDAKNDTETLLRGLKACGLDFLSEIDGQFAFLLRVPVKESYEVWMGRDRWGISPLVYALKDATLFAASTEEALSALGCEASSLRTLPAGSSAVFRNGKLKLDEWFSLRQAGRVHAPFQAQSWLEMVKQAVATRIPERTEILFTTLGGIDSQFITREVALSTQGHFGGAVTVVPDTDLKGDLPGATHLLASLKSDGIAVKHHVLPLTVDYVDGALDRVLRVLGPDFFNTACGLAEDRVASWVKSQGGKAIMTAGGPDEAGRSYKPWTLLHRDRLEEGFLAVCNQFSSSEGVRAGLVFGEHGLENRVPLADLISRAMELGPEWKQEISDWGDGKDPFSIRMKDKIFWRRTLEGVLPEANLATAKETIHGSTGAKEVVYRLTQQDTRYQAEKLAFIDEMRSLGWARVIFAPPIALKKKKLPVPECQLYCLWRWSKLVPELYQLGASRRYQGPFYQEDVLAKSKRPLCYDWMPAKKLKTIKIKLPKPKRSLHHALATHAPS